MLFRASGAHAAILLLAASQLLQGCAVNFSADVAKRLASLPSSSVIQVGALSLSSTFGFGNVSVGSNSSVTVHLSNTGQTSVSMLSFGALPSEVIRDTSIANDCGASLAAGASCDFSAVYTPAAATPLSASFQVTFDPGTGVPTSATQNLTGQGYQLVLSYPTGTPWVGNVGSALSISPQTLTAAGIAFSNCALASGSLPSGVVLNSTSCVISGTPTAVSSVTSYTIRISNAAALSSDVPLSLRIDAGTPVLSFAGSTGTAGSVSAPMSVSPSILTSNGAAVTSCGIKSGSTPSALPAGLSVNATTCVISGSPTTVTAAATYTLVATNSVGISADASVILTVNAGLPVLSFVGSTGTSGSVGTAMSVTPTGLISNGASITACGIKSGSSPSSLPAGLSVDATTCVISGTPTTLGAAATYTLVATNSAGTSADASVSLTVNAGIPVLSYSTSTGTTGTFGTAMTVSPSALTTNGASITACGIKSGSTPSALPAGLTVDATTCVVSGTPTTLASAATYTLVATSSAGTSADATVSLTVNAAVPALSYSTSTGTTGAIGAAMTVTPSTLASNGASITACGIKGGSTPSALPAGLSVNVSTCVISGTPTTVAATATYTLVATNSAGTSADATVSLTVNAGVPVLSYSVSTGTTGTFGTAMTVTPSTLTANGASITACGIKSGSTPSALPAGLTVNATTCVISGTPSAVAAAATYTLVATNSAGISADASVSLTVNAGVPVLSYSTSTGTTGTFGTAMTVTPSSLTTNGASISACGIKGGSTPSALPAGLTMNATTCVISGTPGAAAAAATYTFVATNSVGASADATVSLTVNAAVPTLSYSSSTGTTGAVGTVMTVTPSTLAANGASITACGIKSGSTPGSLPAGLSVDVTTCVISGTPTTVAATATYTLVATNSAGTSTDATVNLTVNAGVPVLSYSASTGTAGTFGTAMTVTPSTLTTNGASITACGIKSGSTPSALPAGLTVNATTCVISGTPSAVASAAAYTLVATNSAGTSADATVSLTVNAAVPTLSYSTSAGTTGAIGTAMTVTPSTLTTNGASITACGIKSGSTPSALPAGLSVDASTCVISGTPSAAAAAATYTLVATSSAGTSADATVSLTVNAAVPTLSYSTSTGTTGTIGAAMTVTPSTLAANGASITTCGIKGGSTPSALPAGLTVNATTCVISGTPTTVASAATYTLVATNSAGTSADATVSLTVNAGAPVLSYSASTGTTGTFGTAMTVTPSTLTTNGASITACGIKSGSTPSALPAGLTVNATTCVISGTPSAVAATATYTLVATNSAGNSADALVALTVNPAIPLLSYSGVPAASRALKVGTAMSISPTTLSPRGAAITACNIKGGTTPAALPAGLSVGATTCVISGTPTAVTASATYTLVATNSVGVSANATIVLSVSAGIPILSYASSTGTSVILGSAMNVLPSTLTTNGGSITACAIKSGTTPSALPAGLTVNATTCKISGTATGPSYATYTLVATNSGGTSAAATVTLAVVSVPVLSYAGALGAIGGTGVPMTVNPTTFSTWGAAITSCGIKSGSTPATVPLGLSIDPATCVISGTPSIATASATYTLVATNSVGTSADATVVLSVVDPLPLSFTPTNGAIGTAITLTGADFSSVQYAEVGSAALIVSQSSISLSLLVLPGAFSDRIRMRTATDSIVTTGTFTVTTASVPATQLGSKRLPSDVTGTSLVQVGTGLAVSADGQTAVVGAKGDNSNTGAVWIYKKSGSDWVQDGNKLVATGATGSAQQGVSVAISADGNTVLVGGFANNGGIGAAWVFKRSAGVWAQEAGPLAGNDSIGNSGQGLSVSLSADGNTALVGGYFDNSGIGAAWVYTRSGGVWTQQGSKLVGTGALTQQTVRMGIRVSLSVDGNTVIFGGPADNAWFGAAWIFTRSAGVWTQQGSKLIPADVVSGDHFGNSVAMSGDGSTAVVSSPNNGAGTGAAYVYARTAGVWSQQAKLLPTGYINYADFGEAGMALSLDGNILTIGGPGDNGFTGAVWVFQRSGTTWTLKSKIVPSDAALQAGAGQYLGLSPDGQTLFIGGNGDNNALGTFWVMTP